MANAIHETGDLLAKLRKSMMEVSVAAVNKDKKKILKDLVNEVQKLEIKFKKVVEAK